MKNISRKDALLVISHGSRREESNDEVRTLTTGIAKQAGEQFESVSCAFLEITAPSPADAIDKLEKTGINRIFVFPHFLAAGTHVAKDIPRAIAVAEEKHPDITFIILPHLGSLRGLEPIIVNLVDSDSRG